MKNITGTFIDEISVDIGSQNWTSLDWRRDFDTMQSIGIDTVVIIRGGYKQRCIYPSKVVGWNHDYDLARFFFEETSCRKMDLFFGTYDSGNTSFPVETIDWQNEVSIGKSFVAEVVERYGEYESFRGWYLTQELSRFKPGARELFSEMGEFCKKLTPDKKILLSPYYPSRILFPDSFLAPDQFTAEWNRLLGGLGVIDYCAFQDGTAPLDELKEYIEAAKHFCDEAGITLWNNVETFEREFPMKFPPIDFQILKEKLSIAEPFVKKHITFEFSHFMSPNSVYLSARNLYKNYSKEVLSSKMLEPQLSQ